MRLRWIQRYYGFSKNIFPPMCEFLDRRAAGMWVDDKGKAHDLCMEHARMAKAEPMGEGCYAPTSR